MHPSQSTDLERSGCLDDDTALGFVDGMLPGSAVSEVQTHLDRCARCRAHLLALVTSSASAHSGFLAGDRDALGHVGTSLHPGDALDRFTLIHLLGRGGMGEVWEAYDPELDRMVAIKRLREDLRQSPRANHRILEEARALARLEHPNVVRVFAVLGSVPAVVMEVVPGTSWSTWQAASHPEPLACIAATVAAGRGLAAMHRVGVVHRDISPRNILISRDGRVLVSDLGLARTHDEPSSSTGPPSKPIGTPGFIAPEQFSGRLADERSDQWSLAAVCWASLFGMREVQRGSDEDRVPTKAPRAVVGVLRRALDHDPARRFPSVDAFVSALERASSQPRRRGWTLLATGLTVGALALLAWSPRESECEHAVAQAAASLRSGHSSEDPLEAQFLDRVDRWEFARRRACTVEGPALDEQIACLGDHRERLRGLARALEHRDELDRAQLSRALTNLDRPDRCTTGSSRLDPRAAPEIAALDALNDAGAYRLGAKEAAALARRARSDDDDRLLAGALLREAVFLTALDEMTRARERMEESYWVARRAKSEAIAFSSSVKLVRLVEVTGAGVDAALQWARHAEAAIERGDLGPDERAELQIRLGELRHARGHHDDAVAHAEAAVRILTEAGVTSTAEPAMHDLLGRALNAAGKPEAALVHHELAIAQAHERLDDAHPFVATAHANRAITFVGLERDERAAADLEKAIELADASVGSKSTRATMFRYNLAMIRLAQGEHEDGLRIIDEVLGRFRASYGLDSPQMAAALQGKAMLLLAGDDLAAAEVAAQRSLQIRIARLGAEHPEAGLGWTLLGRIAKRRGQHEQALERHQRGLHIVERRLGSDHPATLEPRIGVAEALLAMDRFETALEVWRAGTSACESTDEHEACAELDFAGARLLYATGRRDDGLALGREALAGAGPELTREIETWLAKPRP